MLTDVSTVHFPVFVNSYNQSLQATSAHSSPLSLDVPEYARRSFLLDPVTDRFFACMYTDDQWVWSLLMWKLVLHTSHKLWLPVHLIAVWFSSKSRRKNFVSALWLMVTGTDSLMKQSECEKGTRKSRMVLNFIGVKNVLGSIPAKNWLLLATVSR